MPVAKPLLYERGFNEGGFNEGGFNEGGFKEGGFTQVVFHELDAVRPSYVIPSPRESTGC